MGLLDGKKALIFGVANDHSIAWGIAKAFHEHGAQIAAFGKIISVRAMAGVEQVGAGQGSASADRSRFLTYH